MTFYCTGKEKGTVNATFVIAHHPAIDMVDEDIYALLSSLVADTPHAELVFDDDMGDGHDLTTIHIDNVSAADDLIDDGLLDDLSLLDGEVTINIEFPVEEASLLKSIEEVNRLGKNKKWSERRRPVKITVLHKYDPE